MIFIIIKDLTGSEDSFFIYCWLFVLILVVFVLFLLHYVSTKFNLWPSPGDLTATSDRNVVKKKQHKNYQDEDKKSAINKKLILRLRSLISKWFQLKTISQEFEKMGIVQIWFRMEKKKYWIHEVLCWDWLQKSTLSLSLSLSLSNTHTHTISSSSCHAISTIIPDPLSSPPIVHRFRHVFISTQSCRVQVRAGRLAFAQPCKGVHRGTSLMSTSLLLQQCLACLVRLIFIVFVMGGRWP